MSRLAPVITLAASHLLAALGTTLSHIFYLQELLFGLCPGQRQLRSLDYLFGRFAILLLGERGSLSFIPEGYPILSPIKFGSKDPP